MSKLLRCKIDVTKIKKELLFKGDKGTYLDINIWVNDTPDKYGNDCSIQQKVKKGQENIYIGSGKFYKPEPVQTEPDPPENNEMPF